MYIYVTKTRELAEWLEKSIGEIAMQLYL